MMNPIGSNQQRLERQSVVRDKPRFIRATADLDAV